MNKFNLPLGAVLLALVFASCADQAQSNMTKADVIVYGSTPGGFCAAIAAAREGASVILLEPTNHVGGLVTGGLSFDDSNQMVRSTVMGLFDEWHRRIVKDYTDRGLKAPYDPTKKNNVTWTYEPHVAMRVTRQLIEESGVTLLTGRYLQSVNMDGTRISSIVTKDGTFSARVYVDGTYEGDLMAAAGVDWTIGREGRDEFGESYAGKIYPKPVMPINGFDDQGNLLPLVNTDAKGEAGEGDSHIMTYSFRLNLTRNPENKVGIPKPDNYDPARFEVIRRYLESGGDPKQVGFALYRLPGQKFDGNNQLTIQFSTGLVGRADDWHSSDEDGRQKIWEEHKQYTLEFIHFLRTDPSVPESVKKKYSSLGFPKDEFVNNDHFPPALYVRESRRMKGMYIISQKDIIDDPQKDDPIAVASFPIDSHDVQRIAIPGVGVVNDGLIYPVRVPGKKVGYAYHVPYRSVLPKPEQCTNLLVPVALSCTHVAISSLRIEGTWMNIGQGAGVAAAIAAENDVDVQDLAYPTLRERLLQQGQVLDLPESALPPRDLTGVIDDAEAELSGTWKRSSSFNPHE
ncbi:MAG: FAD-dependent oxidoreductase [Verrucomicrobiota bacterium]